MKTLPAARGIVSILAALLLSPIGFHLACAQNAAPSVAAGVIGSVPYQITKPGVYILRKDLVLTSATATAITVSCGDVTIDLGMHTISSGAPKDNNNSSVGIFLSGTGAFTVRNGTLRGFHYGINASYPTGLESVLVQSVTCSACGRMGIYLEFGPSTGDVEIDDCLMRANGYNLGDSDYTGMYVSARNVRVTNCRVLETNSTPLPNYRSGRGIFCSVGMTGVISNNYVSGGPTVAANDGIVATSSSGRFTVSRNSVFNCGGGGVTFASGATGPYQDNLVAGCTISFAGGTDGGGNVHTP